MSDTYVHEPDADGDAPDGESTGADSGPAGNESPDAPDEHPHPNDVDREFDWRGWALVGAVFVAFLLIPGIIYAYPYAPSVFGLTFWDTYLALPMIPAVVLGILAVWATTRP
ncbi:hypothetical protein HWV23_00510 [Natronomonas halophila]|uniref:hypothetical protein n=1 Tax=Natronomonas halophila TaxID=2747817 RepID=UPI0015B67973|nr:hypothetical protein [Natronomonas halophila]QLD84248.1 hypothetical protein HWV23_00510 [Natronomonas halophila]